jgi:hypothetical protein
MLIERRTHGVVLLVVATGASLAGWALGAFAGDQRTAMELRGFAIEKEVMVPLDPVAAFDAFTGDVRPWWDHTFSEKPARLVIEARPGGHFLEVFDEAGNGVVHGLVTWSERGKKLVIRGWLGPFHSMAGVLVHTFSFLPAESGTKITASIRMAGEFDGSTASAVDRVWDHFLIERFKPYAEKRGKP